MARMLPPFEKHKYLFLHLNHGTIKLLLSGSPPEPSIGKPGDPKECLHQTKPGERQIVRPLAPVGPTPHFCITTEILASHLRGISFLALPETFRDAFKVSRALGCRYLWIDSLCIIQGNGGDFNQETKHMEQVYSGEYCVLVVSHTANHYTDFL